MAYTEYGGLPKSTPNGVQTAGLFRGLTGLGESMMQKLWRSHKKDPSIEHFTYDDAKTFPGIWDKSGPFVDMGTREIDPEFAAKFASPDNTIDTAHTHPSRRPGSFSPADYYGMTLMSSGRTNPAGEHWILKPETENWEGLRIKDPDLLISPEEFRAPSAIEALTGNFSSPLFDDVITGKSNEAYAIDDLLDKDTLEAIGANPRIAELFNDRLSKGNYFADKFQPLLMKLADEDRIDYFVPPDKELDRIFDAYKQLLKDY
jgi:hypothetical protein